MIRSDRQREHARVSTLAITANRLLPILLFFPVFIIITTYLIFFNSDNNDNVNNNHHPSSLFLHNNKKQNDKKKQSYGHTNRINSLIQQQQQQQPQKQPQKQQNINTKNRLIGDNLKYIKNGSISTNNVLLRGKDETTEKKSPMAFEEIIHFITTFLHQLHDRCAATNKKTTKHQDVWNIYHRLALEILYPWDREYLTRIPERRKDGTIFLGMASYRDENCLSTLKNAYGKAKNPEKLIVGLVQQNCEADCKTGVLDNRKMESTEPDEDCHRVFCASPEGKVHCDAGRVRALHVNETESLGPYAARYFGSKLWYGEEWFMQIDSHMTFAQDWDALSIEMLQKAPSKKPVISHYPPADTYNFEKHADEPPTRLCGGIFSTFIFGAQIIRLQNNANDKGKKKIDTPRFAPVIAAGYFVASSEFLSEVPYDPFLPWIFMGEEIIMSARMWTHGYDIFSPSQNVVGHVYFRKHKPKFWENTHRVFKDGLHNPLQMMILQRVKYQIGYPESSRDFISPKSVLSKVEDYTLGTERSLEDYLLIGGYNFIYKEINFPIWCNDGVPPPLPEYQHLVSLYNEETRLNA